MFKDKKTGRLRTTEQISNELRAFQTADNTFNIYTTDTFIKQFYEEI